MLGETLTLLDRFREAAAKGTLVKLTLGAPRGPEAGLRNVFVRPVEVGGARRLAFVFRQASRDTTRHLDTPAALGELARLLGNTFGSAHLFTTEAETELQLPAGDKPRLRTRPPRHTQPANPAHDRARNHPLPLESAPWLATLGIATPDGRLREGMAGKYRQIQKFLEILDHALEGITPRAAPVVDVVDMGSGKGYLTFATHAWLARRGWQPRVRGIEARPDLVALCNQAVQTHGLAGLHFEEGSIASVSPGPVDVLVALHACDTATDDALARGIEAGAALMLTAPCCHHELRPQLRPPPVLAGALRHGILLDRHAEFVTDALRAALLEWAGYPARVFEFISTEHTAKNLMIAATRQPPAPDPARAAAIREFASFYGIREQRLARHLGFVLPPA